MSYWIFKVAEQEMYPDVPGREYVYDNTHSVRIQGGDVFLYLDKRRDYSFTATGCVVKVSKRTPSEREAARTEKVKNVFTAHLGDVIWFKTPISILPSKREGRANRAKLGIVDANLLGWSQSMPQLDEAMYQTILDLAQANELIPSSPFGPKDYSVPDQWGKVRVRKAVAQFSKDVLSRHGRICIVCGTAVSALVDAAHISPYASDKKNRANPGNGICLCTYCHRALDRRLIALAPDGELFVASNLNDAIASAHFNAVDRDTRRRWLKGVDVAFLELTIKWFRENTGKSLKP